jgi:hypothetical protein
MFLEALIFRLHPVIAAVGVEEDVARQRLEHLEGLRVISHETWRHEWDAARDARAASETGADPWLCNGLSLFRSVLKQP